MPHSDLHKLPYSNRSDYIEDAELPGARKYITMARIERLNGDMAQESDIVVDTLRPGSASDSEEIALWVQNLLQRIHGEVRQIDIALGLLILDLL